jgi:hypothetical protein
VVAGLDGGSGEDWAAVPGTKHRDPRQWPDLLQCHGS